MIDAPNRIIGMLDSFLTDSKLSLMISHLNQISVPRSRNMIPKGFRIRPAPRASPQNAYIPKSSITDVTNTLVIIESPAQRFCFRSAVPRAGVEQIAFVPRAVLAPRIYALTLGNARSRECPMDRKARNDPWGAGGRKAAQFMDEGLRKRDPSTRSRFS